jgi:short-chain fatty acids transporter
MKTITLALVAFVKRYLPNPYTLAIVLTIIVFICGIATTPHNLLDMSKFFGDGLYSNLAFIMQMIMILFAGYALAISPAVVKMLKAIASFPKTRYGAAAFVFTTSFICGYINWGFGLVAAACIAKEVAARNRNRKIDFAFLVAVAYAGTQVPALSSAIPLQISMPGHFLEATVGVIPLSETLFAPYNIIISLLVWLIVVVVLTLINPTENVSIELDYSIIEAEEKAEAALKDLKENKSPAEKLDSFPLLSLFLVALIFINVFMYFKDYGFMNLSTNTVITVFLMLGMLAHKSPIAYVRAVNEAIKTCGGIALLFPIYYGLMGMMRFSGLATSMSQWFVSISTVNTLPLFTFWSACLVNLFIPSGGGQWAVQGPVMMEAAVALGANIPKTAMAVCWGDLCTNLIQPFWAIPVLAIAKKDVRDIMGYCAMICIIELIIISAGFVLL